MIKIAIKDTRSDIENCAKIPCAILHIQTKYGNYIYDGQK